MGNDRRKIFGIIHGGIVITGIANQDICNLQVVGKIMETKGWSTIWPINTDFRVNEILRFKQG